ncbi:hypothetical protein LMH73_023005 [Vibrio splendidus]|nr:hypothetical protein [Vibrio splendidus]MCC4883025.1 hypothetical protein [Vibrio splendidus]
MTNNQNLVWAVSHNHAKFGEVLLRIGRDSNEDFALYIASIKNGVQHGTCHPTDGNVLTNRSKQDIEELINTHCQQIAPFINKDEDWEKEESWFRVIDIQDQGLFLAEFNPLDKETVLITFENSNQSFWSVKIREEDLYEVGLEKYEENFEMLVSEFNKDIVIAMLKKNMTEEDWIA